MFTEDVKQQYNNNNNQFFLDTEYKSQCNAVWHLSTWNIYIIGVEGKYKYSLPTLKAIKLTDTPELADIYNYEPTYLDN